MRRRWLRNIGVAVAIALALLLGATWWLFYDSGPTPAGRFPLDLAALRTEASRLPGALPERIEVEIVSHSAVPRIAMASGTNWSPVDLVRASYRLVAPGHALIVDTGYGAAAARSAKVDRFDPVARAHILAALEKGDADGAERLMRRHMSGLRTVLQTHYELLL